MKILDNAAQKIKKFNSSPDRPRKSYHCVLNARTGRKSLVDKNGAVSDKYLNLIDWALRSYFIMNRGNSMGSEKEFVSKLMNKLASDETKRILAAFTALNIMSSNLESHNLHVEELYESLSNPKDGLSANGTRFCVGTTKLMHCLLPELFVMLDTNAAKGVRVYYPLPYNHNKFISYWKVMRICRDELIEWRELYGNTDSLLNLDYEPTTLTRIFDKCAIITAYWGK